MQDPQALAVLRLLTHLHTPCYLSADKILTLQQGWALEPEEAGAVDGNADRVVLFTDEHVHALASQTLGRVQPSGATPDDEDIHVGVVHEASHYKSF